MTKPLDTFHDVALALGEQPGIRAITGASPQAYCNWRARGFFPARLYLKLNSALIARGYGGINPALCQVEPAPKKRRRRKAKTPPYIIERQADVA